MWFKSSPAWAPCEQRKHFLISDTKTHKYSNTQRNTSNKNGLKLVYTVKCKFFDYWDLFSQYIFLAIAHVMHSFVKVSNFGCCFFVLNRVFQSCIDSSMNLIDFFFDNLPKIQFFGTKLRQIWFQVYASTSKFMPLTRTTFASHFYLGDENLNSEIN